LVIEADGEPHPAAVIDFAAYQGKRHARRLPWAVLLICLSALRRAHRSPRNYFIAGGDDASVLPAKLTTKQLKALESAVNAVASGWESHFGPPVSPMPSSISS
jgi:hypothetical protein